MASLSKNKERVVPNNSRKICKRDKQTTASKLAETTLHGTQSWMKTTKKQNQCAQTLLTRKERYRRRRPST